ncbi:MAG: hypothetical protein ACQETH_07305 [Candidatus Rifleibacteriota bacterium]
MGSFLVLTGVLLLMASAIWIIGEVLKKDVILAALALIIFPIFSIFWTFWVDYQKCNTAFYLGLAGAILAGAGLKIGIS